MSPKELLYIEDALGHAKFFETQCKETASKLQDPELRSFVEQIRTKHSQMYSNFYTLL